MTSKPPPHGSSIWSQQNCWNPGLQRIHLNLPLHCCWVPSQSCQDMDLSFLQLNPMASKKPTSLIDQYLVTWWTVLHCWTTLALYLYSDPPPPLAPKAHDRGRSPLPSNYFNPSLLNLQEGPLWNMSMWMVVSRPIKGPSCWEGELPYYFLSHFISMVFV